MLPDKMRLVTGGCCVVVVVVVILGWRRFDTWDTVDG